MVRPALWAFGLLSSLLVFGVSAEARYAATCGRFTTPISWKYCIHKDSDSSNQEVLYRLHGAIGDVKDWNKSNHYSRRVVESWNRQGFKGPIVVEISFGQLWVLAPTNSSPKSGLLEFFTQQVVTKIEKDVLGLQSTPSRMLLGESMGGLNAAILIMKYPEMWRRSVIVCPAIASLSPFAAEAQIQSYVQRTGADPQLVEFSLKVAKEFFGTEAEWNMVAPLSIGPTHLNAQTPPTHLSCGDKDEYGFFLDTEEFAGLAQQSGAPLTWLPLTGGHCAIDVSAVADFLTK